MPVLNLHTNQRVEDRDALLRETSALVAEALGKPESYVLVRLSDGQAMSFGGTTEPLAYVELKSLGLEPTATSALSATITAFLEERLAIPPERTYIEFAAPERAMFGWKGGTF